MAIQALSGDPYIAPFPPSIASEPWAYGLALFSDLLVSALCLAMILGMLFEGRRKDHIVNTYNATAGFIKDRSDHYPFFSVLRIRRMIVAGFLWTLLLRAAPDAVWMLAWGEATKETMDFLFVLDWWGDVTALFTCSGALALMTWSGQVIDQSLAAVSAFPLARPKWEQAKQYVSILGIVLLIAVGVTLGKAGA